MSDGNYHYNNNLNIIDVLKFKINVSIELNGFLTFELMGKLDESSH